MLQFTTKQRTVRDLEWERLSLTREGFKKTGTDYLADREQRARDQARSPGGQGLGFYHVAVLMDHGIPTLVRYRRDPRSAALTTDVFLILKSLSQEEKNPQIPAGARLA